MKRSLVLTAVLGLWCLPLIAGEFLMNNSGEVATALRVTFSEPVSITGFGDTLMVVSPSGEATEFAFSGGELEAWGGHWLNWEPDSASLLSVEWLAELIAPAEFNPEEATTVPHSRQDEFQLVLPEVDGGDIVGVIMRTVSVEQIPFVVTYEFESDSADGEVEWTSIHPETSESPQIVTGSSARFVYLGNRHDPEVATKFQIRGKWYEWSDPDISFPLHNLTNIRLDAEQLFPESAMVSAEWSASNGDPDDAATFPIDSDSTSTPILVSQWPNALDVTCAATTAVGAIIQESCRVLLYFRDGPPWGIHGTAMDFGAPMKIKTWAGVLDEIIETFRRMGISSVVLPIKWYYGYPDREGDFSIEPVYHYGDEWSIEDDPRGSTQTEDVIEYVFGRLNEEGIDVVAALLALPNLNEPELEDLYDHSGYGEFRGFMQTPGYLYGDGHGLHNLYTHYIPLFIRTGVDGVLLDGEQGQVEDEGGQISRDFFRDIADTYRDQGFTGMITHPACYAVCTGCDPSMLLPDPEVYDPIVCGIPWDDLGTLSVTFYPTLAETPEDTTAQMQEEALRQLRERLLPLHRVWEVPLFIADMYMFACDGWAMSPVNEECFDSGTYDPEELRRYMSGLFRALTDASDWTEDGWLYGLTAGVFTKYPSWWPISEEGISRQNLNAILNARHPDFPYQDTIQVFYMEKPLTRLDEEDGALHIDVLRPYIPPTLADLGYVLPETWTKSPDLVIDDFEDGLPVCGDSACWDSGGHDKSNPEAHSNLSLEEYASGGHYLSDEFYYTSWLKVGRGIWLDASGYDGIQVKMWASSAMTVDFELGACVTPWTAHMFRGLEIGTQPRVYWLPFSDFQSEGEGSVDSLGVPEAHLRRICGIGFFPDSRGEANSIYIDDLGLYVEEEVE